MSETLKQFKKSYHSWSGFSFTSTNQEDALREIDNMSDTLSNEISDQARRFEERAKQLFVESIECPECLQPVQQNELDTFGGLCEACATSIED